MKASLPHMISFNLRPAILSAFNSYRYNASQLTGNDPEEIMIEDWLVKLYRIRDST